MSYKFNAEQVINFSFKPIGRMPEIGQRINFRIKGGDFYLDKQTILFFKGIKIIDYFKPAIGFIGLAEPVECANINEKIKIEFLIIFKGGTNIE
jgi:hypothetical protein